MFISSHVSGKCQFDTMTRISMASYVRFMHAPTFIKAHGPMDKLSDCGSEGSRLDSL